MIVGRVAGVVGLALGALSVSACNEAEREPASAADDSPMATVAGETPSDPAMAGPDRPAAEAAKPSEH